MFEKKELVTPGNQLAEGDYTPGENTYQDNGKIYSQVLGLADFEDKRIFVVPLRRLYLPKVGDLVIGQVADVGLGGWTIDINAPYNAVLNVADLTGKPFSPNMESLSSILKVGETLIGKTEIN